jgi:molybdopterin-guanine dinucleotide biosynthesis protein A
MAGGNSSRMGRDKSMLMLDGKPMIERVYLQLRPHFDEVLISSNESSKYGFLGLEVVPDSESGRGPLMGIASALAVSVSERNLVVACDIPEVNMSLARRMLRESRDCDVVLARTGESKVEPLFAVYKRSLLPAMEVTLSAGRNKILDAFFDCKIKYVDTEELTNINTMSDYQEFVERKK